MRRTPNAWPSVALAALVFASCATPRGATTDAGPVVHDASAACTTAPTEGGAASTFCDLPGSIVYGAGGTTCTVKGGKAAPTLDWLTLPPGFCAHYFAHVPSSRQVRLAPGGELFVASPATFTAGGAPSGVGGVVVLYDDDGDGFADGDALPHADDGPQSFTMFTSVASVQGLLFVPGAFYFQDGTQVLKATYTSGQRALAGTPVAVVDVSLANGRYVSSNHWPKTFDVADDGTLYVGNGGDQSEQCNAAVFPRPFLGGVLAVDGTPGGTPVAQGFRNPIALRCQRGHDLCFAVELGLDGSGSSGGREKIVPIREGDDWGYPCCATTNTPYVDVSGRPDCAHVASETVALEIGDTPFGLDFAPSTWPAPYASAMIVTLHGQVGTSIGARVVAVPVEADGMPQRATDIDASTLPAFATGWDNGMLAHGRPAAVAVSPDGRAYVANDQSGDIFWVAPAGASKSK